MYRLSDSIIEYTVQQRLFYYIDDNAFINQVLAPLEEDMRTIPRQKPTVLLTYQYSKTFRPVRWKDSAAAKKY
jgi:hypothetical protein